MLHLQATVLIETLPAAFEMDEILFELREHSAGLNCGRWDYIFSFIKTLRADPKAVMPDRHALTLSYPYTAVQGATDVLSCTADTSFMDPLISTHISAACPLTAGGKRCCIHVLCVQLGVHLCGAVLCQLAI